jgi:Acetyltransferase (GNAT) domain
MRTFSILEDLNDKFWEQYKALWQNSAEKSPFQAPEILKYFSGLDHGHTLVFQLWIDEELTGAVVFKKIKNTFQFLSDWKTDANWFVFHQKTKDADIIYFFDQLLQMLNKNKSSLILNNIPASAEYIEQLLIAVKKSHLFCQNIQYAVSQRVIAESSFELFKKIKSSSQTRSSVNKIKKHKNSLFEVFTDDFEMENWVKEFCEIHIRRWAGTTTPSVFSDINKQTFLLGCLKAWNKEKLLVRFSIKLDEKRICFVIGLIENETLIHHSTTFDPDFRKFSPGRSIIYYIAEWMSEQNLNILDFGNGDEAYKSYFANNIQDLMRIFIAGPGNYLFKFKALGIKHIRKNNWLYQLYKEKIKIHFN